MSIDPISPRNRQAQDNPAHTNSFRATNAGSTQVRLLDQETTFDESAWEASGVALEALDGAEDFEADSSSDSEAGLSPRKPLNFMQNQPQSSPSTEASLSTQNGSPRVLSVLSPRDWANRNFVGAQTPINTPSVDVVDGLPSKAMAPAAPPPASSLSSRIHRRALAQLPHNAAT